MQSRHNEELSAAFEELALPLLNALYNLARWLTGNRQDADDLVQETYLKSLKAFSSFQPGTNFRAWMYQILRNTFLTSRTSLRAKLTVPLEADEEGPELAIAPETPETILIARSNRALVRSAIEKLPIHLREVILLCDIEEMSYRETADILSIPIGTVMSRLSRARQAIGKDLRKTVGSIPRNSTGATPDGIDQPRYSFKDGPVAKEVATICGVL